MSAEAPSRAPDRGKSASAPLPFAPSPRTGGFRESMSSVDPTEAAGRFVEKGSASDLSGRGRQPRAFHRPLSLRPTARQCSDGGNALGKRPNGKAASPIRTPVAPELLPFPLGSRTERDVRARSGLTFELLVSLHILPGPVGLKEGTDAEIRKVGSCRHGGKENSDSADGAAGAGRRAEMLGVACRNRARLTSSAIGKSNPCSK